MLRILLFGRPRVLEGDAPLSAAARPKVLPLLAYLLLHRDAPLERRYVAADLWPESTDEEARANLRRHLQYLRNWLPSGGEWVVTAGSHVQWNSETPYTLDVAEFQAAAGDPSRHDRAIELFTGELCETLDEPWLAEKRRDFGERYVGLLLASIASARARRDFDRAIHLARALLQFDPWREDAVRGLMLARYESGDRASALHEYESFSSRIREELGADPMPETAAVYESVLQGVAPAGAVQPGPDPRGALDAGEFELVGREPQLQEMRAAWRAGLALPARVAFVAGEAGIGKTRLIREFAGFVESQGGIVLTGGCAFPETVPYEPIVALLRSAKPLLRAARFDAAATQVIERFLSPGTADFSAARTERDSQRERAGVFESIARALEKLCERRPCCIVLEDLHWAGTATMNLVAYLLARLAQIPALFVLTYRDDESALPHELRTLRRELFAQGRAADIPLARLALGDLEVLLARRNGENGREDARALLERTDGNPLYVTELIRSPSQVASGAANFTSTIAERVAALPEDLQTVALVAAACGSAFDVELLREITGWSEVAVADALGALMDRYLVVQVRRQTRSAYTFSHQLIQSVLYERLEAAERTRQHRRIAQVMERIYPEAVEGRPFELAYHWDRAGESQTAALRYVAAARRALLMFAAKEAQKNVERALELAQAPDVRFDALMIREWIAALDGDRQTQRRCLDEASALSAGLDIQAQCAALRRDIDLANVVSDHAREAVLIETLQERASAPDLTYWRASALEAQAKRMRTLGDFAGEERCFRDLTSLSEPGGGQFTSAFVAHADALIYQGRLKEAGELLTEILANLDGRANRIELARLLMSFSRASLAAQNYEAMSGYAWQAHDVSVSIGDREGEALALHNIANGLVYTFRAQEVRELYARTRTLYAQIGHRVGEASAAVDDGLFRTELGLLEEGRALFSQAEAIAAGINFPWVLCVARINASYGARLSADFAAAEREARVALLRARDLKSSQLESAALGALGAALTGTGALAPAIDLLTQGVALRREGAPTARLGDNLCALAAALLALGEPEGALPHVEEFRQLHRQNPRLAPQPAEWMLTAARVYHAAGRDELARECLREATRILEERLACIPDERTRAAYRELPFNREVASMVSLQRSD